MTAYVDSLAFGTAEFINPIFGSAVNIPTTFFTGGQLNGYEAYFGECLLLNTAALTLGPSPTGPLSLNLTGIAQLDGITNQIGELNVAGMLTVEGKGISSFGVSNEFFGESFNVSAGYADITAAEDINISSPNLNINSKGVFFTGFVYAAGLESDLASSINSKKHFDIPHPLKPKHRLRYVCIEGPTADVYVRGILKEKSVIELPDYWINLVDAESITVNLTPIGQYQELFVEKIEWGSRILIKNNAGSAINCHYTVYGERKDTEKNIPEYEGMSPGDYPGDQTQCSVAGWDY